MSEEKKLNDETVKDVTGGGFDWERNGEAYGKFNANNCAVCHAASVCRFSNTFEAFEQLGGQDCPDFRGHRVKY